MVGSICLVTRLGWLRKTVGPSVHCLPYVISYLATEAMGALLCGGALCRRSPQPLGSEDNKLWVLVQPLTSCGIFVDGDDNMPT